MSTFVTNEVHAELSAQAGAERGYDAADCRKRLARCHLRVTHSWRAVENRRAKDLSAERAAFAPSRLRGGDELPDLSWHR